jgi:hypothetical protein
MLYQLLTQMSSQMAQRVTLANENLKIALSAPQLHNIREAYRRVYESLGTKEIDNLLRPEECLYLKTQL